MRAKSTPGEEPLERAARPARLTSHQKRLLWELEEIGALTRLD